MKDLFSEYIPQDEIEYYLSQAKNEQEKREIRAVINSKNCVVRYRGWKTKEEKNNVFNAIENDRLYFSTALGYNDPYDTLIYVDWDKIKFEIKKELFSLGSYVEKLKRKAPAYANIAMPLLTDSSQEIQIIYKKFFDHIQNEVEKIKTKLHNNIKGICFSENKRSILMWSHYANNHTGISLWYDKKSLESARCYDKDGNEIDLQFSLDRIKYENTRIDGTQCVNEYILYKHSQNKHTPDMGILWPSFPYATVKNIILTKNYEWKYEEEVRLIPRCLDFEEESNVSYIQIRPTAIEIGAKTSKEDIVEIKRIAKEKGITLYSAYLDNSPQYSILFEEIY